MWYYCNNVVSVVHRMYVLWTDNKRINDKERETISKYLQRGNNTKRAQNTLTHKSPTPSMHNYSFNAVPREYAHNPQTADNTSIGSWCQCNELGDLRVMISITTLLLLCTLFLPGLYLCVSLPDAMNDGSSCRHFQMYVTNAFALCVGILFCFFVVHTTYNRYMYRCCHSASNNNLRSIYGDDYFLCFELIFILCLILLFSASFALIEWLHFDEKLTLLLDVGMWTIGGLLLVMCSIATPLAAVKWLERQYKFGKGESQRLHLDLQDVLSYHRTFYAFTNHQLAQELNIENLAFLIEVWQYRYCTETKGTEHRISMTKDGRSSSNIENPLHRSLALGDRVVTSNSISGVQITANMSAIEETTEQDELEGLGPQRMHCKGGHVPLPSTLSDIDVDGATALESEVSSTDDENLVELGYDEYQQYHPRPLRRHLHTISNAPSSPIRSCTVNVVNEQEVSRAVHTLSALPWSNVPVSDSCSKHGDRFSMALDIYNQYLSPSDDRTKVDFSIAILSVFPLQFLESERILIHLID